MRTVPRGGVDQFGAFTISGTQTAQEVDLLRDDLAAVAVDTGGIGPLGVMDAAVDHHFHALFAVLGDRFAKTVEAGDAVPFGVHYAAAFLVALNPTLGQTRARSGQGEVGDLGAALRGADVWVLTDVAGEDDDVLHLKLLYRAEGTIPSTRPE